MSNVVGILGLVFAIIALALMIFVSFFIGFGLGIVAFILSIIGIATCDSKAPGIIGLIISIIVIVLGILLIVALVLIFGAYAGAASS